jgi:hypothetical protein
MLPPLLLCLLLAAIGPLTGDQRGRLETAYDGRDHQEEAFAALVEHAGTWTGGLGDAAVRLAPDLDAMIAAPDDYRGDLCRLDGVLQQRTMLAPPWEGIGEWFVRDAAGRPVLVYVVGDERGIPEGTPVRLHARFYKTVDARARDGETHRYAAFVGAGPAVNVPGSGSDAGVLIVLAPALGAMGAVFILLMLLVRKQRSRPHGRAPRAATGEAMSEAVDGEDGLPDDPVEAMAALRRRAEATSHADDPR